MKGFEYSIKKYDYDLQAYLYTILFNVPNFKFLVIDKGTLDIGVFNVLPETLERGRAKLESGLELYKAFFIDKIVDLHQYTINKDV